jgi:hypothetical protein
VPWLTHFKRKCKQGGKVIGSSADGTVLSTYTLAKTMGQALMKRIGEKIPPHGNLDKFLKTSLSPVLISKMGTEITLLGYCTEKFRIHMTDT